MGIKKEMKSFKNSMNEASRIISEICKILEENGVKEDKSLSVSFKIIKVMYKESDK